jgi:hypothetical protein
MVQAPTRTRAHIFKGVVYRRVGLSNALPENGVTCENTSREG